MSLALLASSSPRWGTGGGMQWGLVVEGVPAIKKNSRQIIRPGGGRPIIVSSSKAIKYERDAVMQLRFQWKMEPLKVPISCAFVFYLPDRRRRDLSNLFESIQDALTKAGVIEDDSLIESLDGSRKKYDKLRPRTEIQIKEFGGE